MSTAAQPNTPNGASSLDSDIDSVFGPMTNAGGNAENEGGDDEDESNASGSETDGEGAAQRGAKQEGEGEGDGLEGFADPLKAPPQRDAQGRIIDANGNVIAASRNERREMYNFNRLRTATEKIRGERDRLRQENDALRTVRDMPGRLGLNLDQVSEAMEFRAKLERDPVSTVRDIVAKVMGNGYTMEQLFGADAPGYINGQLVQAQIDKQLKPLNERFAAEQREQQIADTADRMMNDFIEQHEYADVHGTAIAHIVSTNEGMSPEKAYYELRQWAAVNGFDFTQPLQPQVVAKLEAQGKTKPNGQQQQQRHAPSTPGGTRMPVGAQPPANVRDNSYAAPDTNYRDIVADVFRTMGNGGQQ